jgi:hypothetical protein
MFPGKHTLSGRAGGGAGWQPPLYWRVPSDWFYVKSGPLSSGSDELNFQMKEKIRTGVLTP